MATGFNTCQITEAIQNLPPELREIIYKHYLAIKLRERAALGWNLVHNELLIQPLCPEMERLVHIIVCIAYMHCCQGGCCYPCYKQEEILHEITISVPDIIDLTLKVKTAESPKLPFRCVTFFILYIPSEISLHLKISTITKHSSVGHSSLSEKSGTSINILFFLMGNLVRSCVDLCRHPL